MGANATTSVPVYASGEVLTAANLNITNSGIPVFADSTARTAAFGGSGEKVLAEGQYAYLESDNSTSFWDGAAWQSVGVAPGLVLIKTQTIGTTVASVAVTSAFSSTYDNYKIVINGGVGSTDIDLGLQLGATTTGYYHSMVYGSYAAGSPTNAAGANGSNFQYSGNADTGMIQANIEVLAPNLAKKTSISANFARMLTGGIAGSHNGFLNNTTQYTDFTIVASTGTLTGGTIYVYGYAKA